MEPTEDARGIRGSMGLAMMIGAIVIGSAIAASVAYMQGSEWAPVVTKAAVSQEMASRQGTGSLAGWTVTSASLAVFMASPLIALIAGGFVRASRTAWRRAGLAVLIVAVTLATMAGFTAAAGPGGADLMRADGLRNAYEAYLADDRAGRDLPPLMPEQLAERPTPKGLAADIDPPTSPMASVSGVVVLLVLVAFGSLVGYAFGGRVASTRRTQTAMPKRADDGKAG